MKNNVAGWIIKKSNQSSIVTYNESNCTYKGSGGWYLSFAVNWEDEKQVCRRLTAVVLIQGEQEEVRETEAQKLQWRCQDQDKPSFKKMTNSVLRLMRNCNNF